MKLHNEGEVAQILEGEFAQFWVKLHNEGEVAQKSEGEGIQL